MSLWQASKHHIAGVHVELSSVCACPARQGGSGIWRRFTSACGISTARGSFRTPSRCDTTLEAIEVCSHTALVSWDAPEIAQGTGIGSSNAANDKVYWQPSRDVTCRATDLDLQLYPQTHCKRTPPVHAQQTGRVK